MHQLLILTAYQCCTIKYLSSYDTGTHTQAHTPDTPTDTRTHQHTQYAIKPARLPIAPAYATKNV